MIPPVCDDVRRKVEVYYAARGQSVAHRMDHIQRVRAHAEVIVGHFPGADCELLTLAVLLHDVMSPFDRKERHVRLSMNTARRILNGVRYPPARTECVLAIIAEHSTEEPREGPLSSVEAQILFDADKLDGVGANGIARAFALKGQQGFDPLIAAEWYRKKIVIALDHMQTGPGKAMMRDRLKFVEDFLNQMDLENRGIP